MAYQRVIIRKVRKKKRSKKAKYILKKHTVHQVSITVVRGKKVKVVRTYKARYIERLS